ncbi:unnamed protein product [Amoebophrya sp. A25]|nr:unnamed protein product [Amoebophrya sp. A25]|eukprot:GSA25T00008514001.1
MTSQNPMSSSSLPPLVEDLACAVDPVRLFQGDSTVPLTRLAMSHDQQTMALTSPATQEVWVFKRMELAGWRRIGVLKEHSDVVSDLDFASDGSLLSCGYDRCVYVWRRNCLQRCYSKPAPAPRKQPGYGLRYGYNGRLSGVTLRDRGPTR